MQTGRLFAEVVSMSSENRELSVKDSHDDQADHVVDTEIDDEEFTDTAVLSKSDVEDTDNIGDVSVEINVEELIADIEGTADADAAKKKAVRQRLEDLAEERSFEDTYAVEFEN